MKETGLKNKNKQPPSRKCMVYNFLPKQFNLSKKK